MNKKKVIYSILKELEKGNKPVRDDYGLDLEEYGLIIEMMAREGLIENEIVTRGGIGNKVIFPSLRHARITLKGIDYLEENSVLAKAYTAAKEIREWVKL